MAALSLGVSLPRRGSTVVTILRFRVARRRGAPYLTFMGKFSTIQMRRVEMVAPAEELASWERALVMESWLVALPTARKEGLNGR